MPSASVSSCQQEMSIMLCAILGKTYAIAYPPPSHLPTTYIVASHLIAAEAWPLHSHSHIVAYSTCIHSKWITVIMLFGRIQWFFSDKVCFRLWSMGCGRSRWTTPAHHLLSYPSFIPLFAFPFHFSKHRIYVSYNSQFYLSGVTNSNYIWPPENFIKVFSNLFVTSLIYWNDLFEFNLNGCFKCELRLLWAAESHGNRGNQICTDCLGTMMTTTGWEWLNGWHN